MIFLASLLAGAWIAASPATPVPLRHRRRVHAVARKRANNRFPRDSRLTLLALRRELLHDFLVETGTEKPAFTDARIVDVGDSITIGPTIITIDFVGNPIIRARVRNGGNRTKQVVVSATVRSGANTGAGAEASAIIERLGPGESRSVELIAGSATMPTAVTWKALQL